MLETIIEHMEHIEVIREIGLANFLIGSNEAVLTLLYARDFGTESLEWKWDTVHPSVEEILFSLLEILNDVIDGPRTGIS